MLNKLKKALSRLATGIRKVAGIPEPVKVTRSVHEVAPLRPRFWLPRSAFTKRGAGVRKSLWMALRDLDRRQRLYCRARGWDRGMVKSDGRLGARP